MFLTQVAENLGIISLSITLLRHSYYLSFSVTAPVRSVFAVLQRRHLTRRLRFRVRGPISVRYDPDRELKDELSHTKSRLAILSLRH